MDNVQAIKKQMVVGNLLVTYYVAGKENSATPYVILHGWGSQSSHLFQSMSLLSQNSRVIFFDLPGFGESQIPPKLWGLHEYADFISACLQTLNLTKTIVVGHSFGGSIALLLAVEYPRLVESLILIDSAGVRVLSRRKQIMRTIAGFVSPVFRLGFMQPTRQWIYKKIGSEDYLTLPLMRETYKKVISENITSLLSGVKQKTFLIWGEEDTSTPIANAVIMKQLIQKATLSVIPHAGHFCFLDQPVEFKRILQSYANH
jgi:pimeloyl-ACP methyl ester carboxylesterase